eukprot:GILK01006094.1.p1 GENE.GILK01006094.1~~GILK01006094.1.p1  ORF type:complete len:404 (-),score=47.45 GILK01006094.1:34-1245(-)
MESAASEQSTTTEVMLAVPYTEVFRIYAGGKTRIAYGDLLFLHDTESHLYFLVLDDFKYPLVSRIPIVRVAPNNYVLPAMDCFYGVVFNSNTEPDVIEIFETVLQEQSDFRVSEEELDGTMVQGSAMPTAPEAEQLFSSAQPASQQPKATTSHRIATGLVTGSAAVATGLIKGASFASVGVKKGAEYLKTKLKKNEKPTQVKPATHANLMKAKSATAMACTVTKALVAGALATAGHMADSLANSFSQTKLGQKFNKSPSSGAVKEVAAAGLVAIGTLWEGMYDAAVILLSSTGNATVDVVDHKYGADAASATKEGLGVVGNVALIQRDVRRLGMKALIRATARKTASNIVGSTPDSLQEPGITITDVSDTEPASSSSLHGRTQPGGAGYPTVTPTPSAPALTR